MAPLGLVVPTAGTVFVAGNAIIIYFSYEYFDTIMPQWWAVIDTKKKISDLPTSDSEHDKGTVGRTYGKFLVSAIDPRNERGGNWSYKKLEGDRAKGEKLELFKDVKQGGENPDDPNYVLETESLNFVCDGLYENKLEDQYYIKHKSNIGKYCSVGGQELVTVEESYLTNPSLKKHKDKLASTKHYSNLWFGSIRKGEFKENALISSHYDPKEQLIIRTCENFYTSSSDTTDVGEILKICGLPGAKA